MSQEAFNVRVDNRQLTIEPQTEESSVYYRVSENGRFLFTLELDKEGFWQADDQESDNEAPIDLVFARAVGEAIDQKG